MAQNRLLEMRNCWFEILGANGSFYSSIYKNVSLHMIKGDNKSPFKTIFNRIFPLNSIRFNSSRYTPWEFATNEFARNLWSRSSWGTTRVSSNNFPLTFLPSIHQPLKYEKQTHHVLLCHNWLVSTDWKQKHFIKQKVCCNQNQDFLT